MPTCKFAGNYIVAEHLHHVKSDQNMATLGIHMEAFQNIWGVYEGIKPTLEAK